MDKDKKHLSVRIDDTLLKKFRYACKYEDRTANGQLLNFIKKFVNDFEKQQGKITSEDLTHVKSRTKK